MSISHIHFLCVLISVLLGKKSEKDREKTNKNKRCARISSFHSFSSGHLVCLRVFSIDFQPFVVFVVDGCNPFSQICPLFSLEIWKDRMKEGNRKSKGQGSQKDKGCGFRSGCCARMVLVLQVTVLMVALRLSQDIWREMIVAPVETWCACV